MANCVFYFILTQKCGPQTQANQWMHILFYRRQMVENLKKMQELKAQIKAQIKLAETLKKLSDNAGFYLITDFLN